MGSHAKAFACDLLIYKTIFYLMSRGISNERAMDLIILGFIEKFREELPMEYAVELNILLSTKIGGI